MEQTSIYAYIQFIGNDDFPLEIVTESLGVEPTQTWKVGDLVNNHTALERFYTCWKYKTAKLETLVVEEVLDPIYDIFHQKVDTINQLKKQFDLNVQLELVIIMENGNTPGLVISPEFSRFASSINALIDIDMYVHPFSGEDE
ncbi:MAG: DUF4279 domain-containing protein [Solibacillus sp.]|uniref:DUF4279 domain-containing protein n=1 Tax=unclassified Solibacillus TaxID=2637870 RepID=UPI0030F570B7